MKTGMKPGAVWGATTAMVGRFIAVAAFFGLACLSSDVLGAEPPALPCPTILDRIERVRGWRIEGLSLVEFAWREAKGERVPECLASTWYDLGPGLMRPVVSLDFYEIGPDCSLRIHSGDYEIRGVTSYSVFGQVFAFRFVLYLVKKSATFENGKSWDLRSYQGTATVVDFVDEDCSGEFRFQRSGSYVKNEPSIPGCLSKARTATRCESSEKQ